MSVTLNDLYADLESFLIGYTVDMPKVTSLSSPALAADLTLVVDDLTVDRGFVEIDDELIAVKVQDQATKIVTVYPWGRGQRNTTAAAHAGGARVTSNPRFPRAQMKQEINEAIANLYPDLFGVTSDVTQAVNPAVLTYPVPAAAEDVISVAYQSIGPSGTWVSVRRFRFDYAANTTAFPTGKSVTIASAMAPGRAIQIVYRTQFGQLSAGTDTLASINVNDAWRDIIKLQASAKMLMSLDAARLQDSSVEAATRNTQLQPTQATSVGEHLLRLAQQRVDNERRQLFIQYPQRLNVAGV